VRDVNLFTLQIHYKYIIKERIYKERKKESQKVWDTLLIIGAIDKIPLQIAAYHYELKSLIFI